MPQENKVKPIGNIPLVSICDTCSNDTEIASEEYTAAVIGKATRPITQSFVFVFSETYVCIYFYLVGVMCMKYCDESDIILFNSLIKIKNVWSRSTYKRFF